MNMVAKKASIVIFTGLCLISIPVIGADANTPRNIRTNANVDILTNSTTYTIQASYTTGVRATIETIQNYGIIGKAICLPTSGLTIGNMKDAINALDPAKFPDTNDGGVVYIYSALAAKFPCQ
jgi:hypothetical protein